MFCGSSLTPQVAAVSAQALEMLLMVIIAMAILFRSPPAKEHADDSRICD